MNKNVALAGKLIRTASENPSIAKEAMSKAAALLKQGHPVETSLHVASSMDDKMWAKGYRYRIEWASNSKLKNKDPLYVKSPSQASKVVREDFPNEKGWKAVKLKEPKKAAAEKQAAKDTAAFAAWAIARGKVYSENECKAMLDRLGVPFIEASERTAPKRGPLQVGETVSPDAYNNSNEQNVDACKKYHKQFGEVEKVDRDGIAVRFDDGKLVRFYGENKPGKTLGLGRATRPSVVESRPSGRALVEVIYISDKNAKPPSKSQIQQVLDYVEKGELRGESRNKSYYTGLALKQAEGKSGYYFTVFSQQRDKFPRSMNPKKGTVLYIGRLGGRPGGWEAEYKKMMAEVEGGE